MRVIIDIDSAGGVTGMTLNAATVPATLLEPVSATPPPEVLEAAAKLGALSAGPAAVGLSGAIAARTLVPSLPGPMASAPPALDAGEAPAGSAAERSGKKAGRGRKRPARGRKKA